MKDYQLFWEIVRKYNELMKAAVEGPNCTKICNGDCCSIKIDIPKVLAKEYIRIGYATKEDFIRGDVFSFKLRFDERLRKCFLFDKSINGCKVHFSGIKPPQCWIYPTKFSNPEKKDIACRKAGGWKIIDSLKAKEAKEWLQKYVFLCQLEARKEKKEIKKRLNKNTSKSSTQNTIILKETLKKCKPSGVGGVKDIWSCFTLLPSDGISLQLKKFCQNYNKGCKLIPDNYLDCKNLCDEVIEGLIYFLNKYLPEFVNELGPDTEGEYPFLRICDFVNRKRNLRIYG